MLALCATIIAAQQSEYTAKALLTPQRLRRLQRDRERQTVRWIDFEARVEKVPDSEERGFELALYYAVTHDKTRGREAVEWALGHACDPRQFAWVLDCCGELMTDEEHRKLITAGCATPQSDDARLMRSLQDGGFRDAAALYAACERLIALRASREDDLREQAVQFFSKLPIEFLLSLRPEEVEHPAWMTHVAGLALVAVDPNLAAAQYVQGWAMEDRQMIREGPGVAYEFLWADPYLPGVGYQNLDPWIYDARGRLFARVNWEPQACWIAISTRGVEEEHCPANWRDGPAQFGRMTLVPMSSRCIELPSPKTNETAVLWRLKPDESVSYRDAKQQHSTRADPAGMLWLSAGTAGKACTAR